MPMTCISNLNPSKGRRLAEYRTSRKPKSALGLDVCSDILFVRALLGCDTSSRIHGVGKGVTLKKFKTNAQFLDQASIFNCTDAAKDVIITAGERALLCLYNSGTDECLDSLRYTKFCQKVATGNTCVQPENLPPTSATAGFYSLPPGTEIERNITAARGLGMDVVR